MGNKIHPDGFRKEINKKNSWKNEWFSKDSLEYKHFVSISQYAIKVWNSLVSVGVYSGIKVEIASRDIVLHVTSFAPGLIIKTGGSNIKRIQGVLKEKINTFIKKYVYPFIKQTSELPRGYNIIINIEQIDPERDPVYISAQIAKDLRENAGKNYKRLMKEYCYRAMNVGMVSGIHLKCKGRLRGVTIAKKEKRQQGIMPLSKLKANITSYHYPANTKSGSCGIVCKICYN